MRLANWAAFVCLSVVGIFHFSCNPYKPKQYAGVARQAELGGTSAQPTELLLANDKLSPLGVPLKARVSVGNSKVESEFTPTGKVSKLDIKALPKTDSALMIIEIFEGDKLRFMAKKADLSLSSTETNTVVIDDCNILVVPWDGKSNDGSCGWTISEM